MKVILTENIEALGNAGTVKDVANGYARNYLLPRGLAMPATADALKRLERQRAAIERRAANAVDEARGMAERLSATTVYIYAKSGEQNRLYGSVTTADIATALAAQHGLDIDRRNISLDEPIHRLGSYIANVKLAGGASGKLNLVVDNEANRGKPHPEAAVAAATATTVEAAPVSEAAPNAEAMTTESTPVAEAMTAESTPVAEVAATEAATTEIATAEAAPAAEAATTEAIPVAEMMTAEAAPAAEATYTEATPLAEAMTAEATPVAAMTTTEATTAEVAPAEAAPVNEAASVENIITGKSMVVESHPQVVVSNVAENITATSNAGESSAAAIADATPAEETVPLVEAHTTTEGN